MLKCASIESWSSGIHLWVARLIKSSSGLYLVRNNRKISLAYQNVQFCESLSNPEEDFINIDTKKCA